jgi:kynurenine formamidase
MRGWTVWICSGAFLTVCGSAGAESPAVDPSDWRIVDLTHPFNEDTLYWPTAPSRFTLQRLAHGRTAGGWFYSANAFSTPEHGGTHLDAPIHFGEGRATVEGIPLERLVAPLVVIDVAQRVARGGEFALGADDVVAFEERYGAISPGSVVLLRTGWDRYWPDARGYLGDATPGDASKLRFPSFGASGARALVEERGVVGLGVDTASIDVGSSQDFIVHRIASARDVYGLENLTGLGALPPHGATIVALPMKIEGGSGAPVRAIALLPAK